MFQGGLLKQTTVLFFFSMLGVIHLKCKAVLNIDSLSVKMFLELKFI